MIADVAIIDQILSQENQEFEALVSSMQDDAKQEHRQQTTVSDYSSNEEEYDQLFMEFMSIEGSVEGRTRTVGYDAPKQDLEMDISVG